MAHPAGILPQDIKSASSCGSGSQKDRDETSLGSHDVVMITPKGSATAESGLGTHPKEFIYEAGNRHRV